MALDEMIVNAIVDGVFGIAFDKGTNAIANWKDEREIKRAFREALKAAIQEFEGQQPEWLGGLFDASFFQHEGQPVLAQFLLRDGRPDPSELAARWADSLNIRQPERRAIYTRELEPVASTFLDILSHKLKAQPSLNELQNNRVYEQLAHDLHAIRAHFAAEEATPGTRRDYLRWLIDRNFYIDSRGTFQTQRQVQVKLDEVYVSLRAQYEETPGEVDYYMKGSLFHQDIGATNVVLEKNSSPILIDFAEAKNIIQRTGRAERQSLIPTPEDIEDSQEQQLHTAKRFPSNRPAEIRELADVVKSYDRLVILGDPGGGKTTLLRYLAISHAQALLKNQITAKDLGPAVFPILIRIAEYTEDDNWRKKSLSEFLFEVPALHECPKNGLGDLLHKELATGHCLILLDGLDEIVSADERRGVVDRIEDFVRRYGAKEQGNRFVVTSRIAGYRIAPLAAPFTHYAVQEMDETQIQSFLERWCRAVEDVQTPNISPQERQQIAQREIDNIMKAVHTSPGVRRLAANPLLLRILALIQRSGSRLPQKRIELYKLAADTLARTWRPAQGVPESALAKDEYLTPLLSHLAYWLHLNKPTGIATEREVYEVLGEKWADLNDLSWNPDRSNTKIREEISKFLLQVREHTGLFVERAPKRYGFMHLTFEEYYAARHLVDSSKTRAKFIRQHLHDPRWEEPILLALGFVGLDYPRESSELIETAIFAKGEDATTLNIKPSQHEQYLGRDYLFALRCLGDNIPVRRNLLKKLIDRLADELLHKSGPARYQRYNQALQEKLQYLAGSDGGELLKIMLVQALQSPEKEVRINAIDNLGELLPSSTEYVDIALSMLNDPEAEVRTSVVDTLGLFVDLPEKVVPALLTVLHDDTESRVRMATTYCLGDRSAPSGEVIPALLEALHDPDAPVRRAVANSLGRLSTLSDEVIPTLLEALHDPDAPVRLAVANSLGRLSTLSDEVIPALLEALHDVDSDVRAAVANSLGRLSAPSDEVIPALLEALHDPDADVRFAVANSLGNLSALSDEVIPALLEALHDVDSDVRSNAADSLGNLSASSDKVISALLEALHDPDAGTRIAVASSLGNLSASSDKVISALLEALHDPDAGTRIAVASSLGNVTIDKPQITPALLPMLQDTELDIRFASAYSLVKLEDTSSLSTTIPILCEALRNPQSWIVRRDAAQLLAQVNQNEDVVRTALWNGLLDRDNDVRKTCVKSLVQVTSKMSPSQKRSFESKVIRAMQTKKFTNADRFEKRPAYDSAYDLLWQLVIDEEDQEQE